MKKLLAQMTSKARRLLVIDAPAREDNGWRTTEEGKHYRINKRGDVVAGPNAMVGENVNEHPKGGASGFSASHATSSAWKEKLDKKRQEVLSGDDSDQALFVYKSGFADYDEAVDAMNNGTASQLVDKYFAIMEKNGDPTPTKPTTKLLDKQLQQEIQEGKHGGDWQQARLDYIRDMTGMDDKEAETTLKQFGTWFGGSWSHADTEVLDRYIDEDHAYDGPIYRGMHFDEESYSKFMADLRPGSTMSMNGYNSSWTNDREVAWGFSKAEDRHVLIKCVSNKTSSPVSHISEKGENEILAHSRAQWTVLRVSEGDSRTEIIVMEAERRMSSEDRDQRKLQRDSEPDDRYMPLSERMEEQSKYIQVTPPPPDLEEKLRRLGRK